MIELLLQAERALTMGLVDQAEHLYRQAADADPRNSIAVVGLARVALERADDDGAWRLAKRALRIDPENAAAQRMVERLEEVWRHRGHPVPEEFPVVAAVAPVSAPAEASSVADPAEPVAPEPASPEPASPEPASPEPASPEPASPEPAATPHTEPVEAAVEAAVEAVDAVEPVAPAEPVEPEIEPGGPEIEPDEPAIEDVAVAEAAAPTDAVAEPPAESWPPTAETYGWPPVDLPHDEPTAEPLSEPPSIDSAGVEGPVDAEDEAPAAESPADAGEPGQWPPPDQQASSMPPLPGLSSLRNLFGRKRE